MNHNASTVPGGALSASFRLQNFGITRDTGGGIRLFANDGSNDNVLLEISYDYASNNWMRGFQFPNSSGRAGALIVGGSDLATMHLINRQNNFEIWWWLSTNTAGRNNFPSGNWRKGMWASFIILPEDFH